MGKLTLEHAADYVRTSHAPAMLLSFIQGLRRIFTFTQERSNRLVRYVIITRAYRSGQAVQDIETKYGCSKSTVLRYARLAEIEKRPRHFPEKIRRAVIADYKNPKMSVADIARLHDVSPGYVSKIAREEGISRYEPRPKRKRRA